MQKGVKFLNRPIHHESVYLLLVGIILENNNNTNTPVMSTSLDPDQTAHVGPV